MTKRNLSIVALILQLLSVFMLYMNGTFIWSCYNKFSNISKTSYSFYWLIDTQLSKGFFILLLLGLIVLAIIVSVIVIFKEIEFLNQRWMVVLPIIILLFYVGLCIWGNGYSSTFKYQDEIRHASADYGILFYVELVVLIGNVIIEFAKQFLNIPYCGENYNGVNNMTNADELQKYKALLDNGAITQEEYETKKKQLLDL